MPIAQEEQYSGAVTASGREAEATAAGEWKGRERSAEHSRRKDVTRAAFVDVKEKRAESRDIPIPYPADMSRAVSSQRLEKVNDQR